MSVASVPAPSTTRRPAVVALVLALLGLPGVTLAWDLPAGGFWIGMPLAFAALILGVRAWPTGRGLALTAIVLAGAEILFTLTWTLAG
jgi:hypothetical protein